jgi:hypothetical protein
LVPGRGYIESLRGCVSSYSPSICVEPRRKTYLPLGVVTLYPFLELLPGESVYAMTLGGERARGIFIS